MGSDAKDGSIAIDDDDREVIDEEEEEGIGEEVDQDEAKVSSLNFLSTYYLSINYHFQCFFFFVP